MFGKILIVLLMLTSLVPSMSLGGSNVRYLPAFNVLLMIAAYALFCLKDRENREHLWVYYKGNKYILIVVVLYIITIWVSSYKTGMKESIAMISGISVVLVVMHFLFPVLVKKRKDFLVIPAALFSIGMLNALFALEFLISSKVRGSFYGIYRVLDLSDKFAMMHGFKITVLQGVFSNPNSLGMLIALAVPACLFLILEAKRLSSRIMLISCLLFFLFVVFSSFSRASILASAIMVLLFPAVRVKLFFNIARIFLITLSSAMALLIIAGTNLDLLSALKITSAGRVAYWNKSIESIQLHMKYGIGSANIVPLLSESAHNTFIEIALGFGIPALIFYALYMILAVLKAGVSKERNLSIYTILTVAGFSVLHLFETLQYGGLSIANFYFLIVLVSYLSVTSSLINRDKALAC